MPLFDWDKVNRLMRTNRKMRRPEEGHGAATTVDRQRTRAEAFLCNDSVSSHPSRQRGAVTSHTESVEQTKNSGPFTFSYCHFKWMCCSKELKLCRQKQPFNHVSKVTSYQTNSDAQVSLLSVKMKWKSTKIRIYGDTNKLVAVLLT